MSEDFEEWYAANFSHLPDGQNAENKEIIAKLWNMMLERLANKFQMEVYDELGGEQIAEKIRFLKVKI